MCGSEQNRSDGRKETKQGSVPSPKPEPAPIPAPVSVSNSHAPPPYNSGSLAAAVAAVASAAAAAAAGDTTVTVGCAQKQHAAEHAAEKRGRADTIRGRAHSNVV